MRDSSSAVHSLFRRADLHDATVNETRNYPANFVKSSKYSWWNFLPKNLWEQFHRVANIYFLFISLLQVSTNLSPTNKYATIGPLVLVLSVVAIKEAYEDIKRHNSDKAVNSRIAHVLRDGEFVAVLWTDVRVGDIIRLENRHEIPADIALLASATPSGSAFVETSNLDGETNFKSRQAIDVTSHCQTVSDLEGLRGFIDYEQPNNHLYRFEGTLHLLMPSKHECQIPITIENVLLRGCVLRNTTWVYGFVLFTGPESKLIKNSTSPPSKRSNVEKTVNSSILFIFLLLVLFCIASTLGAFLWNHWNRGAWYLPSVGELDAGVFVQFFITFIILYNNLVPISLYVAMEFAKLWQNRLIACDLQMYYEKNDTCATANTSNLVEDLGQVKYVFSDKTGTLTRNEMVFSGCSFGGQCYQSSKDEDGPIVEESKRRAHYEFNPKVRFDDARLLEHLHSGHHASPFIQRALTLLAVCHTVTLEELEDGSVVYQAASPDELALVDAAKCLGFAFDKRTTRTCELLVSGEPVVYRVLHVIEFNSTRKRMSVVVRGPDDKVILMSKGADNVMLERLDPEYRDSQVDIVHEHLKMFSTEGLRTLVLCERELSEEEYDEWRIRYEEASSSLVDREAKVEAAGELIETKLRLIGATAIEDKLQVGVPEAIESLLNAEIKVWMLTGDKQETAINIARSCSLITDEMSLILINAEGEDTISRLLRVRKSDSKEQMQLALVIDGNSLMYVMGNDALGSQFADLAKSCKVVVACRVSPLQKAQLVELMQRNVFPCPVTLSIGDGANDVSMIQKAHIGVGISGYEGTQAVRASDYAIAQFRFLVRLLLVHGRWNYRRVALVILYSFYKNVFLVLTLFCFNFLNGCSGTTLYESFLGAAWNVLFTFVPICVAGVLNRDLDQDTVIANPSVYTGGQRSEAFNVRVMCLWMFRAVLHTPSLFLCLYIFDSVTSSNGQTEGLFTIGTAVNFSCVLIVTFKLALEMNFWATISHVVLWGSIVVWIGYVLFYSLIFYFIPALTDFFFVGFELFARAPFYFMAVAVPIAFVLIVDASVLYVHRNYFSTPVEVLQEIERGYGEGQWVKEESAEQRSQFFAKGFALGRRLSFTSQMNAVQIANSQSHRKSQMSPVVTKKLSVFSILSKQKESRKVRGMHEYVDDEGRLIMADRVTLSFVGEPKLEDMFLRHYANETIRFAQGIIVLGLLATLLYSIIKVAEIDFSVEPSYGSTPVIARLAAVGLGIVTVFPFIFSRFFRRFYDESLIVLGLVVGVAKTVFLSESGVLAASLFPILAFFLVQLRFLHAKAIVWVDLIFYNIIMILRIARGGDLLLSQLFVYDLYLVLIVCFGGAVAYRRELALRMDFLVEQDVLRKRLRATEILDNILPRHVTHRINDGNSSKVVGYEDSVSVLFCDVQDFAKLVLTSTPGQLLNLLDSIYSKFDELCDKHGVQKMETVGQTFMACSGLNGSDPYHALSTVELAQDMLMAAKNFRAPDGSPIDVRIGIHTGSVISGVVGHKRPQFCLFGDTVNTASRMQSTGERRRIQVSPTTYPFIREHYSCESRTITAKGKGEMTVYQIGHRLKASAPVAVPVRVQQASEEPLAVAKNSAHRFNPFTLRFADSIMENRFVEAYALEHRGLFIFGVSFFAGVYVMSAIMDTSVLRGESLLVTQVLHYAYVVLCGLFLCASLWLPASTPYLHSLCSAVVLLGGMGISVLVITSGVHQGETTVLSLIVFIGLICNSCGLRFLSAGIVATLSVIFFTIITIFSSQHSRSEQGVFIFFVVFSFLLNLPMAYWNEVYLRRMKVLLVELHEETLKTDGLLEQMLPMPVVTQLKAGRQVADEFANVFILVSDIVGFTSFSSRTTPGRVVELLATLFSHFDKMTDHHGVYKVQTIGDAYVVVSGLPIVDGANSRGLEENGVAIMGMAMDMIRHCHTISDEFEEPIDLRVGIHLGKLVAGVIGTKKLRYDIWGGDVLVANAMESSGVPGKIVVSDVAHKHLKSNFEFSDKGLVNVKGKGHIQSFVASVD